jgi:hypothetical protein
MERMPDRTRERLTTLRNGLLRLHKILLDSEREAYERDVQRITSRGQLLELVMSDPWFAWLRELSRFIIEIDEFLDAKEPKPDVEGERLLEQARNLVAPSEFGSTIGFARKYFDAMQRDPGVVLAHGDMMRAFEDL